jgi:hypothetical protein
VDRGLAEQGQITDRYTTAVDQIGTQGDDHLETRLGGVYALERLIVDSPRDRRTIIDVLSAFVRSSAPRPDGKAPCSKVKLDVQAALTVLGTYSAEANQVVPVQAADLGGTCLNHANLVDTNLPRAIFTGADLTDATLTRSSLNGANFTGATLTRTNFAHADLTGVIGISGR